MRFGLATFIISGAFCVQCTVLEKSALIYRLQKNPLKTITICCYCTELYNGGIQRGVFVHVGFRVLQYHILSIACSVCTYYLYIKVLVKKACSYKGINYFRSFNKNPRLVYSFYDFRPLLYQISNPLFQPYSLFQPSPPPNPSPLLFYTLKLAQPISISTILSIFKQFLLVSSL